jgi:hypothetical protein
MIADLLLLQRAFPADELQAQHEDAVENRDQEKGDEGGNDQPTNLRIAERFPKGPSAQRERKESQHGGADGDDLRAASA